MKYNGVDVDHPSIVSSVKNLTKQGKRIEEIVRIVGMPFEVVEKYMREARKEMK
jgi:transposase